VPRGFARSIATTGSLDAALYAFVAFYAVCILLTWGVYLRGRADRARV
jgi:NNP family nitrate/nitrite transporter-like MFS transporter